jgi:hypothetical protein
MFIDPFSMATVSRSQALRGEIHPMLARASALVAQSAALCTILRRISGSSDLDSPFIVEIISTSAVCLDCLARKTGIPLDRTSDAMERVRAIMAVLVAGGRCEACLRVTTVYRLAPPAAVPAANDGHARTVPAPLTQNEAIWRYLESRRGDMFCTQCIAGALSATRRIDRAVLAAEGRGALRRYGLCVACGKERLLCGLTR